MGQSGDKVCTSRLSSGEDDFLSRGGPTDGTVRNVVMNRAGKDDGL